MADTEELSELPLMVVLYDPSRLPPVVPAIEGETMWTDQDGRRWWTETVNGVKYRCVYGKRS